MTSYQNIFTGQLINPSQQAYNAITLTANLSLAWPLETAPNSNLATPLIDLTSSSTGAFGIIMPPATQVGVGTAVIVNNKSSYTQSVYDNANNVIASLLAGAIYIVYVTNNSTAAGVWNAFQYGAQASAPNAAALAGAGLQAVGSQLAQNMQVSSLATNYSLGVSDRTKLFNWTGGSGTITIPLAATVLTSWYVQVRNSGTSILTLLCQGSDLVNGSASIALNPGDSAFLVTDGSDWYTVGLGATQTSTFQFIQINLAGLSGNYTLTGTALNKVVYRFTGALAGNIHIIVPGTVQEYWTDNETSGAYTLDVGTSGQVGPPAVGQGTRAILYCDGSNVYNANTAGLAVPIAISQGGTGATTANSALVNFGGTSLGIGLFTAASTSAAQASLGTPSVADAVVFSQIF